MKYTVFIAALNSKLQPDGLQKVEVLDICRCDESLNSTRLATIACDRMKQFCDVEIVSSESVLYERMGKIVLCQLGTKLIVWDVVEQINSGWFQSTSHAQPTNIGYFEYINVEFNHESKVVQSLETLLSGARKIASRRAEDYRSILAENNRIQKTSDSYLAHIQELTREISGLKQSVHDATLECSSCIASAQLVAAVQKRIQSSRDFKKPLEQISTLNDDTIDEIKNFNRQKLRSRSR